MTSATQKSFRFESDAQAAVHAREAVRDVAAGAPDDVLSDVLLCVTELVTNSVTHAGTHAGEPVEMSVWLEGPTLRVEVVDRGSGFDDSRAVLRDPADEEQRQRGWGLYIVSVLADRWGVEPGRLTRVWFEKDVSGR
jgi:anti-sigma regulatory factor (Ser/Thr protein kinase)